MISLFSIRHPNYCPNNRDKSSTASHCRLQLSPQVSYFDCALSHVVFAQRRCSRDSSLSPRKCGESEGRDSGRDIAVMLARKTTRGNTDTRLGDKANDFGAELAVTRQSDVCRAIGERHTTGMTISAPHNRGSCGSEPRVDFTVLRHPASLLLPDCAWTSPISASCHPLFSTAVTKPNLSFDSVVQNCDIGQKLTKAEEVCPITGKFRQ